MPTIVTLQVASHMLRAWVAVLVFTAVYDGAHANVLPVWASQGSDRAHSGQYVPVCMVSVALPRVVVPFWPDTVSRHGAGPGL